SSLRQHIIKQLNQNACGLILIDFINSRLDFLITPKFQTPKKAINLLDLKLEKRNWLKWCHTYFPWYIKIDERYLLRFMQKYKTITEMEVRCLFDKKDQPKVFSLLDKLVSEGKLYKYHYPISWRIKNEEVLYHRQTY
ncbi:MAG: hypothetical protein QXF82_10420, partial [Nitrososphaeria archaeon]